MKKTFAAAQAYTTLTLILTAGMASTAIAAPATRAPAAAVAAARKIDGASLLGHIKMLASDDFEGRSPGTPGELATTEYLRRQFVKLGLAPGNPDGSYFQKVPLLAVTSQPTFRFSTGAKSTTLSFPQDFVAWSPNPTAKLEIPASEIVFVGYGVQAPEYQWDDYKGVDLRGKTLLMLINDPAIPDPRDPSRLDPAMFGGKAMTYYGRWTYKFEMAAKAGAAAALIVHETKPAAYPYEVVQNSWGRENFAIKSDGANPDFPLLPGWIQLDRAKDIFRSVGYDFDTLKKTALSRDFKPVPLDVTATIGADSTWRDVGSNNVIGKIEGSDPLLKNEYIIYSAHWDHFGIDTSLPGPRTQQIFHGARDNASGVAALLEVAKAYKALRVAPKRSILFLMTTGEERGLLGAQYYARHPLVPLNKTVLNINVDGLNLWGRTRDIEIVGYGKSTSDELVAKAARWQGRVALPDTKTERGSFYRADQFEFAKVGVPGVYLKDGNDFIGKPPGYGKDKVEQYIAHDYHKVSDVVMPGWDMRGAVDDVALLFHIGYDAAQDSKQRPVWNRGAEFKAAR
ncbi:M28 family peptidase [Janthinobacterium agaricidamnosum]|uniref:Peptidase M28 family protein n=1 Tax=Janthinobacterium agaricidamnosum NBRC 102515 = DSM 9628 TaxID=1349767 RepID=W0UYZ5_9BURK|nr:M28 family peptidase [Janthinobacterium agaricidamnosum]CDG80861.1 peptidase M28 family protein [Janthinobacterium agaricidamnosum NBRC 102515 = DSM 9628]